MKVVSSDHKQANNLTSLISFYFEETDILFSFVFVKTNRIFDLFLFREYNYFYFINPTHSLYILVPGERLVFNF